MVKWMLAAGAAALAIAAPTAAERGDRGGGQQAQKADRGGQARAKRGGGDRQVRAQRSASRERASRGGDRVNRASRGSDRAVQRERRAERPTERRRQQAASLRTERQDRRVERQERRVERQERRVERQRPAERRQIRAANERQQARGNARRERLARSGERDLNRRAARLVEFDRPQEIRRAEARRGGIDRDNIFQVRDIDRRGQVRLRDVDRDVLFARRLGFNDGCPPGLAKKHNGCLPPGQAAKFIGQPLASAARLAALSPLPSSLQSLYWDDDDYYYRYGGGYLYRVDRDDDLIASLIPLFGAALIGRPLQPYYLNNYYQPAYFNSFYRNSPYDCYRYGYGYVYETDCVTGLVEDVIPTYDYGYGVGQIMPASYGYYNVPFAYRSYFADDDDYYYRYAPGAIYRVDRDTSLIAAVAALLTGGLSVGQPLPIGYSAYNVPLAYRSTYYDRPDVWYRYNNGYIYAVDPGTRVVRSVEYVVV